MFNKPTVYKGIDILIPLIKIKLYGYSFGIQNSRTQKVQSKCFNKY
jgi:hypothetical protein